MNVKARYLAFVDHHSGPDWLSLGWMPSPALEDCYHGQFSVLVAWICDCRVRRPIYVRRARVAPRDPFDVEVQRDYDEEHEFGWGMRR